MTLLDFSTGQFIMLCRPEVREFNSLLYGLCQDHNDSSMGRAPGVFNLDMSEVRYQNDIGRHITVSVSVNEGPDYYIEDEQYDWKIILDDDSVVYFTTKKDFYDWLDRLNKTFSRP